MRYALVLFALVPFTSYAQIYQYVDPDTGSKKLTNIAPAWYSAEQRRDGPRTLLIVRGKVINDTSKPTDALVVQQRLEDEAARRAEDDALRRERLASEAQRETLKARVRQATEASRAEADARARKQADLEFQRRVSAIAAEQRKAALESEMAKMRQHAERENRAFQDQVRAQRLRNLKPEDSYTEIPRR